MAEIHLRNAFVKINTVDLSDHVRSVTIAYGAEILDKTAMGDSSRTRIAGLKDWSCDIEFNQDFAAAKVDATLFSLVGSTDFAIKIKAVNSAPSATNPQFAGRVLLESYPPLGNAVGELATVSVTFQGDGDLSRETTTT